jgi:hypothetical protein
MTGVINGHQGIPPRARYAGLVGMTGRTPLSAGQTRKTRRTPSPEALKKEERKANVFVRRTTHYKAIIYDKTDPLKYLKIGIFSYFGYSYLCANQF